MGTVAAAVPTAGAAGAKAPDRPRRLLVVSDSTLAGVPVNGALDDLRAALPGWEVTYDARAYRNTAQGVDIVAGHDPADFDAVVVGLGNNDAWSPDYFAAQMARMIEVLAPVPNVYWLTVREAPRFQQPFARVNAVIRARAAAAPRVEVVDWNRYGAEHPEAFYDDGLHLTPAGGTEMAQFLASVVKRRSPYLEVESPPSGPAPEAAPGAAAPASERSGGAAPAATPAAGPDPAAAHRAAGGRATGRVGAVPGPSKVLVAATIGGILLVAAAGIVLSRSRSRATRP